MLTLCVQNDKGVPSLRNSKVRFLCPSLRAVFTETAWQSINLNANLPLDCHEFARSRFANSRNDKFLVILTDFRHTNLSCHTERSEVSTYKTLFMVMSKCKVSKFKVIWILQRKR